MNFLILTLFPEMFEGPFSASILQRAQEKKLIDISCMNIREFGLGKHRQVDDTPYGGGAGMVMRPDVLAPAIRAAKEKLPEAKVVFLTPQGQKLTQRKCEQLASEQTPLIVLCGHFEGIDERVREMFVDEEICVGDCVFTGGEIPAMALVDSVARLLPGVVGNHESTEDESFCEKFAGRGEYPHYTKPEDFEGMKVPGVLLSGHHGNIDAWRMEHLDGLSEREFEVFQMYSQHFSPVKPWKSRLVLFRKHISEDIEYWLKWLNDEDVTKYVCLKTPYTREDAEEDFLTRQQDFQGFFLTLLDRQSSEPIGSVSLQFECFNERVARCSFLLGAKNYWGKGLGTEALQEFLKIAFEVIGLQKLSLQVFQDHVAAIALYEKVGFQIVGEQKQEIEKEGKLFDIFLMEFSCEQWKAQQQGDQVTKKYLDLREEFGLEE